MNDKGKIIIGLVIFLIIMTFPIWYNFANGKATYVPNPEIATKGVPGRDACVMDTEFMKTSHMDLLNDWRNIVVRDGTRIHTAPDGKKYNMSLSNTCLDCHSNKEKFCDQCHSYVGVDPYCWSCHIIPEEVK